MRKLFETAQKVFGSTQETTPPPARRSPPNQPPPANVENRIQLTCDMIGLSKLMKELPDKVGLAGMDIVENTYVATKAPGIGCISFKLEDTTNHNTTSVNIVVPMINKPTDVKVNDFKELSTVITQIVEDRAKKEDEEWINIESPRISTAASATQTQATQSEQKQEPRKPYKHVPEPGNKGLELPTKRILDDDVTGSSSGNTPTGSPNVTNATRSSQPISPIVTGSSSQQPKSSNESKKENGDEEEMQTHRHFKP